MNLPGGDEPPPGSLLGEAEPAAYAGRKTSGGGVAVNTRAVAVMEAEQQAAVTLITDGVPGALMAKNPGLWGAPAAEEAATRLGWVTAAKAARTLLGSLTALAGTAREDGLDNVVLAGSGESTLAPEVIARSAGAPLQVLDTTDPHEVARTVRDRPERTLVVVASKSGSAVEADSSVRIYRHAFASLGLSPGEIAPGFSPGPDMHLVALGDPVSPVDTVVSGPLGGQFLLWEYAAAMEGAG